MCKLRKPLNAKIGFMKKLKKINYLKGLSNIHF